MSYGDYSGPDKPNKGHEGGACNRQHCQAEPALYYNHGSYSWYCKECKVGIGDDWNNRLDWNLNWKPKCGHNQFETREEIDAREATPPMEEPPKVDKPFEDDDYLPFRGFAAPVIPKSASLQKLLRKAKLKA